MIIVGLETKVDVFVVPGLLGSLDKVFWEELLLLVEIVSCALLLP
jgi:hypothetical protein